MIDQQAKQTPPHCREHWVAISFRIDKFKGNTPEYHDGSSAIYHALNVVEHDMFQQVPAKVDGWLYKDPMYGIEVERLELCQPEFSGPATYDVSVVCDHELAVDQSQATQDYPLTVQALVAQLYAIMHSIFSQHDFEVTAVNVSYGKHYEYSTSGTYEITLPA